MHINAYMHPMEICIQTVSLDVEEVCIQPEILDVKNEWFIFLHHRKSSWRQVSVSWVLFLFITLIHVT